MLNKVLTALKFINRDAISLGAMTNRTRVMADYVQRSPVLHGFPLVLHLEVTNVCNLSCKMCPRSHMTRDLGYMDFSLFKRIIDQTRGKIDYVELYLFGEPLLHPRICEMIKYCKDSGLRVAISTNGTCLTESKCRSLVDCKIDFFTISLDGITAATYSRIRGNVRYDQVLAGVENFLRITNSSSPRHVVVQLIEMRDNAAEIERFTNYWTKRGIQVHLKPLMTWTGDIESINLLNMEKKIIRSHDGVPCDRLWRHLTVFWDGTVVPCHYIYNKEWPLGYLAQQTVKEVWNGKDFVDFRKRHIVEARKSIPCCSMCQVRSLQGWELMAALLFNTYALRKLNTIFHYN
jgi:radical SAM protein with 4Fe4S-binding SPASM domain